MKARKRAKRFPLRHFLLRAAPTAGNSHHHAHDYFKSVLKTGANQLIDETEEVMESIAQHKYSQLANASYTYYNSKGNAGTVHEGLDSSYIDDLSGFRVDTDLSSRDNVVLHNSATGETHVAYRGTAEREFFKRHLMWLSMRRIIR